MPTTEDPQDPRLAHGVDQEPVAQAEAYLVLSDAELSKGFIRPLRIQYLHDPVLGGCGAVTRMGMEIAETYARRPDFYGATYCVGCRMHRPVGRDGEFVWVNGEGPTGEKVGT